MDPWSCQVDVGVNIQLEIEQSAQNKTFLSFEDNNFKPAVRHTLPDSEQYLALLEEKLNKIRSDTNVLRQLAEKREDCMQQLLNGCVARYEDANLELDEPITNSAILRTIQPQKQALTQGEVVELIKYDQLVNETDSSTLSSSQ